MPTKCTLKIWPSCKYCIEYFRFRNINYLNQEIFQETFARSLPSPSEKVPALSHSFNEIRWWCVSLNKPLCKEVTRGGNKVRIKYPKVNSKEIADCCVTKIPINWETPFMYCKVMEFKNVTPPTNARVIGFLGDHGQPLLRLQFSEKVHLSHSNDLMLVFCPNIYRMCLWCDFVLHSSIDCCTAFSIS